MTNYTKNITEVGVVGLGLMGCSIITALLVAGNRVIALAPLVSDLENATVSKRTWFFKIFS
jgi:3-hydroxyacyl-CoA dehydrogenase